jgi:hypothetical protein
MPLTPAQEVAKAARIAKDRDKLEQSLADPNLADSRHIYGQLYEIVGSNPVTANAGSGAADVANGIDASADIDVIKSLIADIKAELVNTTAIADILIQDGSATPRYFVRQDKIDQTTGLITTAIVNLDGTAPSPAPVAPLAPVKAGSSNLINEDLYTVEVAGTGYAIGDSVANVRLLNGETGLVVVSSWYNITQRAAIASAPPIASIKGYEDKIEELLSSAITIATNSSTSLANLELELGNNGDITIPATNLDPATLKALIRRSNDLIEASSPIDTIGSTVDLSIPSSPTQPATLKGLDRGVWQTLLDTIVNTGDPSDTTIPATVNDPSTSKGIGRLSVSTLLNLITKITDRSQFTRITDGTRDAAVKAASIAPAATDPALVVAVSPNSGLVPTGTVVTGESIASGSGFLGWTSWIAKQTVAILGSVGLPADLFASTDAGTFSAIALIKRLNLKFQQGSQPFGSAIATIWARKTTNAGWTSTGVSNQNILDGTGAGVATDVRDYNSMQIVITTAAANMKVGLQLASDAAFTTGVSTMEWQAVPSGVISTAQTTLSGSAISRFNVDLINANYIRIANSFAGIPAFGLGSTINYTLSQAVISSKLSLAAGSSLAVTSVGTIPAANLQPNLSVVDVASAAITTSTTTASILPSGGISYQVEFDITAITGADTVCNLSIEESYNSGLSWRRIYTFEPITFAKGTRVYKSDFLPLTGDRIRYVQTITGIAPSITRSILRTQSNLSVPTAIGTRESGGFNVLDLPIYGRTRRILANNRTAAPLFLAVYAKNIALAAADRPINGQIYLIPATGLSLTSVADWGEHGTVLSPESVAASVQVRLGVSSTFAQMTIPTGLGTAPNELFSLFVESV